MPHFRTQFRGAFTLIELLITVMILAISAAIVVPMVGGRDDLTLSASTRKVIADMQFAQNYAIATRQSIYVKFAADRYDICRLNSGTLVAMTHPVEKSEFVVEFGEAGVPQLQKVSLPQASIGGEAVLGFDSLGTPFAFNASTQTRSSLSSVVSINMACGELTQAIQIEPYTGEITAP